MNTTKSKFQFVILSDYIEPMYSTLKELNIKVIKSESDIPLGYFSVEGENESINLLKDFLNGYYSI